MLRYVKDNTSSLGRFKMIAISNIKNYIYNLFIRWLNLLKLQELTEEN